MDEKKLFYHSLVFPAFFLFALWFIKLTELGLALSFVRFGIFPLSWKGIAGIFFSPFIHADFNHLTDNSLPLFFLLLTLFYFYRKIAYKIFILLFFLPGIIVWFIGRPSYHIGASSIIYGLAFFIFLSGMLRRNRSLMAISLLVSFLYGSMVWGLLPYDYKISWEGHLGGALTGIILALLYKDEGPEPDIYQFEEENTPFLPDTMEVEFKEESSEKPFQT